MLKGGREMRSAFDFAPFRRSTVGFDRLFDLLESSAAGQSEETYPPFDLVQLDDTSFRINLAVAGFKKDEIDITTQQNLLIVTGRRKEDVGRGFIHRGIATRSFERRFGLADHVTVRSADLSDGLLSIDLVREIPEAMRPRKIDIGAGDMKSLESDGGRREQSITQKMDEPVRESIDA
jgi:molecular chaperone IbpA